MKTVPTKIMEIGVAKGDVAESMITAAKKRNAKKVRYYGFDLFETAKEKDVMERLKKTGARIRLFRGDTRKVLPRVVKTLPKMDLIYIDGGHSYDVVKSDWTNVKKLMHKHTVVVFHDYGVEEGVTRVVKEIDPKKIRYND